jgi:glutamate-ammonia-ligase adenylyltransferase
MNIENCSYDNFPSLLQRTLSCSRYMKNSLASDTALLDWLHDHYLTPFERSEMLGSLQRAAPADERSLAQAMRELRKQVMAKLILRDLNGLADLNEVIRTVTALAEVCLQQGQKCLMPTLQRQFGAPIGESSGSAQELLVIGMGKLGGEELNVSSDIDLVFVYPEDGQTTGPHSITNHEFFSRLGRRLINLINEPTSDGYVFRVDMRLRPYGDSGPLVTSFAALEEYLVSQGREWERYAWIKARIVAPAKILEGARSGLDELVKPFVYRRYLDFGAIESMRSLHAQIRREVLRRDRASNIKLGPGGIREIEFVAQVFQLIRGGQDISLRVAPTRRILEVLSHNGQLETRVVKNLDDSYVFLRNLEHRLQYLDDQQTQDLPTGTEDQQIIATAMGYQDYPALMRDLAQYRSVVSQQFEQIFREQLGEPHAFLIWQERPPNDDLPAQLTKLGYKNATETAERLRQLNASSRYQLLPEQSKQRLDKLVPQFISLSAKEDNPDATLSRLLTFAESVCRRAAYLAFLYEFPRALQRLTKLVAASSWATEYLTQHPALLDELLASREIYLSPQWQSVDNELAIRLQDCAGDAERQMNVLRHVQQEQIFHLLAMDLQGLLPLEMLSDHLSDLADMILKHVLKLCWTNARKRHRDEPTFAIISYGKLGGKELGYSSDLDLIFLYDDSHPDAQENYSRLAQRINTALGSYTSSGRLYETDLRLRPNGASGLLVSSIEAFSEYQLRHAWVWEHQALTRARFSAGNKEVGASFEEIRQNVLCQRRDPALLRKAILEMRRKMHDGHPNESGLFDIKHDPGGMVDVEFIVQYLVLAYAHRYPQLAKNIGNLALLKLAAELRLIPVEIAEETGALYRLLRQIQHKMRLNNQTPCRIPPGQADTAASIQLWKTLIE